MVQGYYTAVIKELKSLSFAYDRNSKGSHEVWRSPAGKKVIVPRNLNARHTANAILRDAGSKMHF